MTEPTDGDALVTAALESNFDSYSRHRTLHTVPPHRTDEVTVDGTRAVCKVATHPEGAPEIEGRLLRFVGRETSLPVPEVLAVGPGYFVARWHPDVPKGGDIDAEKARTMGAGLATLHEETTDDIDAFGQFVARDDTVVVAGTEQALGDTLAIDGYDRWAHALCRFVADHADYLDGVGHGDVARQVADRLRERPGLLDGADEPVLCHGNWLAEHVGTDGQEVACVIDFEHALAAPAAYDVWRSLLPLGSNDDDDALVEQFRAGYESVRSLPDDFDRRRRVYEAVLSVSYLHSLYLQDQHDAETTRERADWIRDRISAALEDTRT